MRTLLVFLFLVVGALLFWQLGFDGETPEGPGADPVTASGAGTPEPAAFASVIEEARAETRANLAAMQPFEPSAEERALWRDLRPVAESQVPDPDGVGPCPPPDFGGHPALVVRRFRQPGTGYLIWDHEDGARTILHPGFYEADPRTGERVPKQRTITKQVPTPVLPLGGSAGAPGDR